jgi:hypothetical protein
VAGQQVARLDAHHRVVETGGLTFLRSCGTLVVDVDGQVIALRMLPGQLNDEVADAAADFEGQRPLYGEGGTGAAGGDFLFRQEDRGGDLDDALGHGGSFSFSVLE